MTVQDNDEWVLVPKEPTKAMLDAVWAAELDIYWNYGSNEEPGGPADVYRALLAAAPTTPSADRIAALEAEIERLRSIIEVIDNSCPRADETCAEPGITISEAARRTLIDERHHAFAALKGSSHDDT